MGGAFYLIFAAEFFSDEKFAEFYAHRAAHLLQLHAGKDCMEVVFSRLQSLIS